MCKAPMRSGSLTPGEIASGVHMCVPETRTAGGQLAWLLKMPMSLAGAVAH